MYKEYLLEIVDKGFYRNDITNTSQYIKLRERIELMDENDCEMIVEDSSIHRKTAMSGLGYGLAANYAAHHAGHSGAAGLVLGIFTSYQFIYRALRPLFDKCSGSCGALAVNTPKRQICMSKCNVIVLERGLAMAKKNNLDKSVIAKIEDKLALAKSKYKRHQAFASSTGRNPNPNVEPERYSTFKIPD